MQDWINFGYEIAMMYAYIAAILFILHVTHAAYTGF